MFAADYPFLDVMWTMLVFFLWVAWSWLLFTVFGDIKPGRARHPPRLRFTILIDGHAGPLLGGSGRGGSCRDPLDLRPPFTLQG